MTDMGEKPMDTKDHYYRITPKEFLVITLMGVGAGVLVIGIAFLTLIVRFA